MSKVWKMTPMIKSILEHYDNGSLTHSEALARLSKEGLMAEALMTALVMTLKNEKEG